MFQSLTGRLQTAHSSSRCRRVTTSFNPSQVGYKPNRSKSPFHASCVFQSLTGRLQTFVTFRHPQRFELFQSLTGRLQTSAVACTCPLDITCFNPSQVGYKHWLRWRVSPNMPSFNPSQVGYKLRRIGLPSESVRFQSLTGRLQTV